MVIYMATQSRERFIFILTAPKVKELSESVPLKVRDRQEMIQHLFIYTSFHPATCMCAMG